MNLARSPRHFTMPWTKENRMSTILIAAVVIVTVIGVFGITSVANHGNGGTTPIITSIVGFVGIAINQFLGMLKSELNRKVAAEEAKVIATGVDEARAVAIDSNKKITEIKATVKSNLKEKITTAILAADEDFWRHYDLPKDQRQPLIDEITKIICNGDLTKDAGENI